MSTHHANFYVVVKAERSWWGSDPHVIGVKGAKIYQNKPNTVAKDEIVVKINLKVPDDAFEPFEVPEVEMTYIKPELSAVAETS